MKKTLFTTALLAVLCSSGAQTPVQIKDIYPGSESGIPSFENVLAEYNGKIYFAATDSAHGTELWVTDGTENGTNLLKDIYPGTSSSNCQNFYAVNGFLLFSAATDQGTELWRSDGTSDGTTLVKDIYPGAESGMLTNVFSYDKLFYVWNNALYFTANEGANGWELWKSDGTPGGTALVKNIYPYFGANGNSFPEEFGEHNGLLYFAANGPESTELWVTDGTTAGTKLVKDIASSFGSNPSDLISCNGYLLFIADADFNDSELWRSDGTAAGTVKVKDIDPAGPGLGTQPNTTERRLVKIGNTVFFSANDGTNGRELWKSDGAEAGTVMVKNASTDSEGYAPQNFAVANNILYYKYDDNIHDQELWRSNGTESGTFMVKDITPGFFGAFVLPTAIAAIDNQLFFGAANNGNTFNIELWKSDGTAAGTNLLADLNPNGSSFPQHFLQLQDVVIFTAQGANGNELWKCPLTAPVPLTAQITGTNALDCFGDTNGAITVTTSGGQAPYTYQWAPASLQGASPAGLGAGTYTVTITDAQGNTLSLQKTISQPTPLMVNTTSAPEINSLMNGSVSASASGGTPPYTYSWNTTPPHATPTVSNLSAGVYSVTVTDSHACSAEKTTEVTMLVSGTTEATAARFKIQPTLSKGSFSITSELPVHEMDVRLIDYHGRELKRWKKTSAGDLLDVSELVAGNYLVYVTLDGRRFFAKELVLIR